MAYVRFKVPVPHKSGGGGEGGERHWYLIRTPPPPSPGNGELVGYQYLISREGGRKGEETHWTARERHWSLIASGQHPRCREGYVRFKVPVPLISREGGGREGKGTGTSWGELVACVRCKVPVPHKSGRGNAMYLIRYPYLINSKRRYRYP